MGLKQYVKNIICENETAKRAYIKRRGRDALLIKKAIVSIGPFIYAMRHKEDSFSRNGYIAKVAVGGGE